MTETLDETLAAFRGSLIAESASAGAAMEPCERGLYALLVIPNEEQLLLSEKTREAVVASSIAACEATDRCAREEVMRVLTADTLPGIIERNVNEQFGGDCTVQEIVMLIRDHVSRVVAHRHGHPTTSGDSHSEGEGP